VLCGLASSITISIPWASLLRGVLGLDPDVLAGIAALRAPGAEIRALVSVVERDGVPAVPAAPVLTRAYAQHGLALVEARPATDAEVRASGSTWAKRLRVGSARPVTLLRLR
jgi:16S rRNA (adenine(1408)-N(1))-methyltransferase